MPVESAIRTYDEIVERLAFAPIVNRPAAESAMRRHLQMIGADLLTIEWWDGRNSIRPDRLALPSNPEADAWQAVTETGHAAPGANALGVGRNIGRQYTWTPLDEMVLTLSRRHGVSETVIGAGKSAAEAVAWASVLRTVQKLGELTAEHALKRALGKIERYSGVLQALLDAYCNGLWAYQVGSLTVTCIERPMMCVEDGRLHSARGPALNFAGADYFYWRGVEVPKFWIERPAEIDPQVALTEQNVERRRVATEIIGWKRIIEQLDARVIDRDDDPAVGELLEVHLPHFRRAGRFLRARCGTGRTIVLCVPSRFDKAADANAWTQGITVEQLRKLEVRT